MNKGVAVPYIIAILLGVAVIGLIGYWLFTSGGNLGTSSKEAQCNSNLGTFCSKWLSSGAQPAGRTDWDVSCNTILKITTTIPADTDCRNKGYTVQPSTSR